MPRRSRSGSTPIALLTAPLIGYYSSKGILRTIDGMASIDEVASALATVLEEAEGHAAKAARRSRPLMAARRKAPERLNGRKPAGRPGPGRGRALGIKTGAAAAARGKAAGAATGKPPAAKTGRAKTGRAKTGAAKTGPAKTGAAKTQRTKVRPTKAGAAKLRAAKSRVAKSRLTKSRVTKSTAKKPGTAARASKVGKSRTKAGPARGTKSRGGGGGKAGKKR